MIRSPWLGVCVCVCTNARVCARTHVWRYRVRLSQTYSKTQKSLIKNFDQQATHVTINQVKIENMSTTTECSPWVLCIRSSTHMMHSESTMVSFRLFLHPDYFKEAPCPSGAWTHDPESESHRLYRLNQSGAPLALYINGITQYDPYVWLSSVNTTPLGFIHPVTRTTGFIPCVVSTWVGFHWINIPVCASILPQMDTGVVSSLGLPFSCRSFFRHRVCVWERNC